MLARTVVGLVLAVLIAPAVSAQGASCINAFQPIANLNSEGAVVLELQATRNDCFGKGQLTGWEVSADGRLYEPVTTSSLLNNQQADGARLQANTNAAGLYMFRPVFDFGAGPQAGTSVPISVAAAGRSKVAALRLPKVTTPEVAPTTVAMNGIADPEEAAAPFSNTKKAMAEAKAAQNGPHVVNGEIAGGGGTSGYSTGGSYVAPAEVTSSSECPNGTIVNGVCRTTNSSGTTSSNPAVVPCTNGTVINGVCTPNTAGVPGGVSLVVPLRVDATKGMLTGKIGVSWAAVSTAGGYNIYRDGVKLASTATTNYLDVAVVGNTAYTYSVRSLTDGSLESADSAKVVGWANVAPTETSAKILAITNLPSPPILPTVADLNSIGSQGELYTYVIVTQPPAGQGTASVVTKGLQWTPPVDQSFAGLTNFTYKVTDKAGESVVGTAEVTVTPPPPPAPTGFTATQGLITGKIKFMWQPMTGGVGYIATGYNIYREVDASTAERINPAPILDTSFTYDAPSFAAGKYFVRAMTTIGESRPSPSLVAWANGAPTASYVTIYASQITGSAPTPVTIVDPNLALSELEQFVLGVEGKTVPYGEVKVIGTTLVWNPAKDHNYTGTFNFEYTVQDKGKATITGKATVIVAPAANAAASAITTKSAVVAAPKTDPATEATAYACAKKFSLLQPGVANKTTPLSVQLTLMKNADVTCAGSALDLVFEVSTDNKTYLPLVTAPFVNDAQITGDSATNQATLVLPSRGLYYFRVQAITASRSVIIGPVKVVAP